MNSLQEENDVMPWTNDTILPRVRVIADNDYGGDADGLVQLAHHALSPSVDLRCVIGSHLPAHHADTTSPSVVMNSVAAAQHVLSLAGRHDVPVLAGSDHGIRQRDTELSAASQEIITEAMREDVETPLVIACGGGLTAIAAAWIAQPAIAKRLTLIWCGGREYDDAASSFGPEHPQAPRHETNTGIDIAAAQIVFNESDLDIWQVPRDVYASVTISHAELTRDVASAGALGAHLFARLGTTPTRMAAHGLGLGEVITLGDSPLVLLTALTSGWSRSPDSSDSALRPRLCIRDDGHYGEPRADGAQIRVFTRLDVRLLLADFAAKMSAVG